MEAKNQTSENKDSISLHDKYWIKPGISVKHREGKSNMIVDRIVKKSRDILFEGKKIKKSFTVGVECHWMDLNGSYQKGMFHTYELLPADNNL